MQLVAIIQVKNTKCFSWKLKIDVKSVLFFSNFKFFLETQMDNTGPHQEYIRQLETAALYVTWWMGLGLFSLFNLLLFRF